MFSMLCNGGRKYPNSDMLCGRILSYVGKVEIERYKYTTFRLAYLEYARIKIATELFINDRVRFVPGVAQ